MKFDPKKSYLKKFALEYLLPGSRMVSLSPYRYHSDKLKLFQIIDPFLCDICAVNKNPEVAQSHGLSLG